jgi:predicted nucleic acid-binding protein
VSRGFSLDAGALIALDRGQSRVVHLLDRVIAVGGAVEIPAPVIAQVWRGGSRQARLTRLLGANDVVLLDLDAEMARAVGILCGAVGVPDVVDGHVALHARRRDLAVLTSDPDDLARLDPTLAIVTV